MFNSMGPEQCQALLDVLWRQSVTGLALVSSDGNFVRVNPAFCRLVEYTEYELQRKLFHEITDPTDVEAGKAMSNLIFQGSIETFDMTRCYITKTREFLPVLLRVTGLRMNEKFIYFVAEIAPLDKAPLGLPVSNQDAKRIQRMNFSRFIKDYWIQIGAVFGLSLAVIDRIMNHFWKN